MLAKGHYRNQVNKQVDAAASLAKGFGEDGGSSGLQHLRLPAAADVAAAAKSSSDPQQSI